jgi:hypothetical protein
MTTPRTIWVSKGAVEYIGGTVTEDQGKALFPGTLALAFSADSRIAPDDDAYVTPTVDTAGATAASRVVKLLIDSAAVTAHGLTLDDTYYLWVRITDVPEIAPRPFSDAFRPR